jgi:hypothetical protein
MTRQQKIYMDDGPSFIASLTSFSGTSWLSSFTRDWAGRSSGCERIRICVCRNADLTATTVRLDGADIC